jgi:DNA-directed RNA polymerase subunit E'
MFYKVKISDHIRLPPDQFGEDLNKAIIGSIKTKYSGYISKDFGLVIEVADVEDIQDGIIIPGDGASYYKTVFNIYTFKPEMQEVVPGMIKDIADFGAFLNIGPIEGMIHISQTMNDFVSFTKDKVLQGKDSKHTLKVNDKCHARIIAISYKDIANPKLGLTMRQPGLGKMDWIDEDLEKGEAKKAAPKK